MNFAVEFHEEAEKQVFCWTLPRDVLDELERRLYSEVAAHPTQHLRPLQGAAKGMEWTCRILESGSQPKPHLFVFRFRYLNDQTLQVRECWHFPLRG